MTEITIHPLTPTEIVYLVYDGEELVHIGESESIVRAFNYVQETRKALGPGITAKFFEATGYLQSSFSLPQSAPRGCLFRGNLERLLQAAFVVRYGRMPRRDAFRGGKGAQSATTGGYVAGVEVVRNLFALFESLLPAPQSHPWPELPATAAESIDPASSIRRPATRRRCLAFWVELLSTGAVGYLGYVPDNNRTPDYGAPTREIVWKQTIPGPQSCVMVTE